MSILSRSYASKREYLRLFLVCAFPVHVWAIINLLNSVPSLILEMNALQLMSVASYVFVFALFESFLVFIALILASLLLPAEYFTARLLPVGAMIVLTASISVILIHLYDTWQLESIEFSLWAITWIILGLVAIAFSAAWMGRNHRLLDAFRSGAERVSILSVVYISADLLGLFLILIRNTS
jgi:hypothetical protein